MDTIHARNTNYMMKHLMVQHTHSTMPMQHSIDTNITIHSCIHLRSQTTSAFNKACVKDTAHGAIKSVRNRTIEGVVSTRICRERIHVIGRKQTNNTSIKEDCTKHGKRKQR
eukprot:1085147_1